MFAILLAAGLIHGFMASINGVLGNYLSPFGVSLLSHFIPALLLIGYQLLIKKERLKFSGAPWYVYLVGLMGAGLVLQSTVCVMNIGAATTTAMLIVGQMVMSEFIDSFGLFATEKTTIKKNQIPGYIMLIAGIALVIAAG